MKKIKDIKRVYMISENEYGLPLFIFNNNKSSNKSSDEWFMTSIQQTTKIKLPIGFIHNMMHNCFISLQDQCNLESFLSLMSYQPWLLVFEYAFLSLANDI